MTRERPVRICEGGEVRLLSATRLVMGFERESDARNMAAALKERLAKFRLTLHEEKTRLIMFGRYAVERRAERGMGRPETFHFLGLTHFCDKTRNGRFIVRPRYSSNGYRPS